MAFQINPASRPAQANQSNEEWKATAFINLWLRRPDGTRTKLGAIPLKASRKFDAALIARLQEPGAIEKMMEVLDLDFQMVDDGKVPELPF